MHSFVRSFVHSFSNRIEGINDTHIQRSAVRKRRDRQDFHVAARPQLYLTATLVQISSPSSLTASIIIVIGDGELWARTRP